MASNLLFAVVEFTEEKTVSVVPSSWLLKNRKKVVNKCYYPTFGGEEAKKILAETLAAPNRAWKSFPARVLKYCGKLPFVCF